jgi:hypothetical protein
MKNEKAEKTMISMTPSTKKKGLSISKKVLGKENLSGIIGYLIEQEGSKSESK